MRRQGARLSRSLGLAVDQVFLSPKGKDCDAGPRHVDQVVFPAFRWAPMSSTTSLTVTSFSSSESLIVIPN